MIKRITYVLFALAVFAVSGCANGTPMSETPGAMNSPAPGMARIVVYRKGVSGAAIQPLIKVSGNDAGRCVSRGVFMVDVPAGEYLVSAETEVARSVSVTLEANEVAYVRCEVGMGLLIGRPKLSLVDPSIGRGESAQLSLTGSF